MKKDKDISSSIAICFQIVMTVLIVWIFSLGIELISSAKQTPSPRLATPMDSTITTHVEKDSSSESIKKVNETTKQYSLKINEREASPSFIKESYDSAYSYFILSAGLLAIAFFLPRLQSFTFKDITVTVKEAVRKEVEEAKEGLIEVVNTSQESTVGEGGKAKSENRAIWKTSIREQGVTQKTSDPDDPQKGRWGGSSKVKGRILEASVSKKPMSSFYDVILTVKSTNDGNPLTGKVKFHLHDTFANPNPVIAVQKGIAKLELVAWGAFTVGAETDDGKVFLELDLSSHEVAAPKEFKEQ